LYFKIVISGKYRDKHDIVKLYYFLAQSVDQIASVVLISWPFYTNYNFMKFFFQVYFIFLQEFLEDVFPVIATTLLRRQSDF
jgi:hypothetical protein